MIPLARISFLKVSLNFYDITLSWSPFSISLAFLPTLFLLYSCIFSVDAPLAFIFTLYLVDFTHFSLVTSKQLVNASQIPISNPNHWPTLQTGISKGLINMFAWISHRFCNLHIFQTEFIRFHYVPKELTCAFPRLSMIFSHRIAPAPTQQS